MTRLSKEQVKKIIAEAPPGTSPEGIIALLRQDYELEGYPSDKVTQAGFDVGKLKVPAALAGAQLVGTALKDAATSRIAGQLGTALQGAPTQAGLGARLRQAALGTLSEHQGLPATFVRNFMNTAPPQGPPPMAGGMPPQASITPPPAMPEPPSPSPFEGMSPFQIADQLNAEAQANFAAQNPQQAPLPQAAMAEATAVPKGRELVTQELIDRLPGLKNYRPGETIDHNLLDRIKTQSEPIPSRPIATEGKPARAPAQTDTYSGGRGKTPGKLAETERQLSAVKRGESVTTRARAMPELPPAASMEEQLQRALNAEQIMGARGVATGGRGALRSAMEQAGAMGPAAAALHFGPAFLPQPGQSSEASLYDALLGVLGGKRAGVTPEQRAYSLMQLHHLLGQ